jgi:hypothetical protein
LGLADSDDLPFFILVLIRNAEIRARFIFSVRPTAANATACFQIPSSRNNNHDDSSCDLGMKV